MSNPHNTTMTTTTTTTKTKKKRLSGGTMGLRFMQRRIESNTSSSSNNNENQTEEPSEHDEKWEINNTATTCNSHTNTGTTNQKGNDNKHMNNISSNGNGNGKDENDNTPMEIDATNNSSESIQQHKSLENERISNNDHQTATTETTKTTNISPVIQYYEKATNAEMYGIRVEIIGRRSFNSFNTSVEDTYQAAVQARRQSYIDEKVKKEHISDEEMLMRYEKYVKGRGGDNMANGGGNHIGNLKNKVAKKRKR
mmetsp:Transcript_24478/g.30111  ORF Transcript_24478/g.30111 Transcript_24478/m.30111 type:complete len:254 (-) Transcript_24478:92-853(-)